MLEKIFAHIYKQSKITSRRLGDLATLFFHPLIGMFSVGTLAYFAVLEGTALDTLTYVFVGVISWSFFELTERAVTFSLTLDIWDNCLKHSFAAKQGIRHMVTGNSIFGLSSSIIAFTLISVISFLVFGFNILAGGLVLIPAFFYVFLFAVAIGLLINSLLVYKGEKYMALIWMLPGLIMIFSGVYYPISVLPGVVGAISSGMPTTYALEAVRGSILGTEVLSNLVMGAVLSVIYLVISLLVFRYAVKKGKENGVIAKY